MCTLTEKTVTSCVVIREANHDDFEWVAELMVRALSPFYDGDHYAHAKRIFDTHISGGIDQVGHFSAGQHMFVAEIGGKLAGLVHLVDKKQATVKISPLIVDTEFRGMVGVGSQLLNHAEDYARSINARQIYCTVAAPNMKALDFFIKKGFWITGTAKDHYKRGVDEHMLYKQLHVEAGFDSPNISVVPFDESRHAEGVRRLIIVQMEDDFLGVDDDWVDALFAGYRRRDSSDINTKYKIIFVAEDGSGVVGVAGATPKKGDPIKLMPLVASNEMAFEALTIDLQELLGDYGRKLYVHLVPEPWQIACLQRHGWKLEGVFPGGYAPNSVVQQWGLNLDNEGDIVHKMRIKRPYYDAIMAGKKTLEVRVGYDNIRKFKAGELIQLETGHTTGVVRIKDVRVYRDFRDMLSCEPWEKIAPQVHNLEEALELLRGIYGPSKEALGVYVLEITKV